MKLWLTERAKMKPEMDAFFISERRIPLSRKTAGVAIRAYDRQAGLSVEAHRLMLRHACGFALADQGADTRLIQDYLGYSPTASVNSLSNVLVLKGVITSRSW